MNKINTNSKILSIGRGTESVCPYTPFEFKVPTRYKQQPSVPNEITLINLTTYNLMMIYMYMKCYVQNKGKYEKDKKNITIPLFHICCYLQTSGVNGLAELL